MNHRSNSRISWHVKVHDVGFVEIAAESQSSSGCLVPLHASKRVAPLYFLGPNGLVSFWQWKQNGSICWKQKFKGNVLVIIDKKLTLSIMGAHLFLLWDCSINSVCGWYIQVLIIVMIRNKQHFDMHYSTFSWIPSAIFKKHQGHNAYSENVEAPMTLNTMKLLRFLHLNQWILFLILRIT